MNKQLELLSENSTLSAIYLDKSNSKEFAVGYIITSNPDFTLMKHFDPHGNFDGYSVRRTDDIYRIETNSRYTKKIKQLMDLKKSDDIFEIGIDGDLMKAIIDYAQKNHRMASIEIDEAVDNIMGYINIYSDETVGILQVTDYGEDDGETIILTESILEVSIGNLNIVDYELLHDNQLK